MFDPITAFHEKIGEPLGEWIYESGFKWLGWVIGWAVALAMLAAILFLIVSVIL